MWIFSPSSSCSIICRRFFKLPPNISICIFSHHTEFTVSLSLNLYSYACHIHLISVHDTICWQYFFCFANANRQGKKWKQKKNFDRNKKHTHFICFDDATAYTAAATFGQEKEKKSHSKHAQN